MADAAVRRCAIYTRKSSEEGLELISEQVNSVDEIARREQMDKRSVRRLLRLGFLSPRIIEAIAEGA